MSESIQELLEGASASLGAAKVLLREGYPGFAVARAYYTMFYIAEAMLAQIGLSYSKHRAVISAFGRQFVKSGKIEAKYHGYLRDGFKLRLKGDYEALRAVSIKTATLHIGHAEEFLEMGEEILRGEDK